MLRRSLVGLVVLALVVPLLHIDAALADDGEQPPSETVSEKIDGLPLEGEESAVEPEDPASESDDPAAGAASDSGAAVTSEPVQTAIPFTTVGFKVPDGAEIWFRTSEDGEQWTDWTDAPRMELEEGPDQGSAEERDSEDWTQMTDAIWVGEAQWLQVTSISGDPRDVEAHVIDTDGLSRSLGERVIDAFKQAFTGEGSQARASDGRPTIISRSGWGANESWRNGSPSYASGVNAVVVHHTAGGNGYTQSQAAGVVRGIYHWHTQGLGWNDIGYNMLVDRYGRIYEGRHGGLDRAVIGAHAAGYNTGTFGISVMGNFESAQIPAAAFDAVARASAWKASIHGINPQGNVTLNSRNLPTIFGHRDVGSTLCPGRFFYQRLGELRDTITAHTAVLSGADAFPLSGDWNGDGRQTPGWYMNGRFYFRNSLASGSSRSFSYGRRGDLPVVGDWNRDGRQTIGIIRDGRWHLKNSHSGGAADIEFRYGRINDGDYPLAGDWNGDGRDTVGIVRDGEWHLRNSNGAGPGELVYTYGRVRQGDIPVTGDWNGNRRHTPGIVRGREWHLRNLHRAGAADVVFRYGTNGDIPVPGDWDGSGVTTPGIVRGFTWHPRNSNSGGSSSSTFDYAPW